MKVARMLAMHYMQSESIPLFMTSRRMQLEKKFEHLKNRRELLRKAREIYRNQ